MRKAYYITLNEKHGPVVAEAFVSDDEYHEDGLQIAKRWIPPYMLDSDLARLKETLSAIRRDLGFSDFTENPT